MNYVLPHLIHQPISNWKMWIMYYPL